MIGKFTSFQRQLNFYEFQFLNIPILDRKMAIGSRLFIWQYGRTHFHRDFQENLHKIRRVTHKDHKYDTVPISLSTTANPTHPNPPHPNSSLLVHMPNHQLQPHAQHQPHLHQPHHEPQGPYVFNVTGGLQYQRPNTHAEYYSHHPSHPSEQQLHHQNHNRNQNSKARHYPEHQSHQHHDHQGHLDHAEKGHLQHVHGDENHHPYGHHPFSHHQAKLQLGADLEQVKPPYNRIEQLAAVAMAAAVSEKAQTIREENAKHRLNFVLN